MNFNFGSILNVDIGFRFDYTEKGFLDMSTCFFHSIISDIRVPKACLHDFARSRLSLGRN